MKIVYGKLKKESNGMKTAILYFSIMAIASLLLAAMQCGKTVPNDTTIKKPAVTSANSSDSAKRN
jgi:hypothetical protein